jgi:hypothetical protein
MRGSSRTLAIEIAGLAGERLAEQFEHVVDLFEGLVDIDAQGPEVGLFEELNQDLPLFLDRCDFET